MTEHPLTEKVKPYKIVWTKTYYMTGEFTVEATDEVEAEVQAAHLIGDQEGKLHYIPYEDSIEVKAQEDQRVK